MKCYHCSEPLGAKYIGPIYKVIKVFSNNPRRYRFIGHCCATCYTTEPLII